MKLAGKKVVVTGGAGFIGSHLVDLLVKLDARVTVVDNLSTGKLNNLKFQRKLLDFKRTDICDFGVISKIIKSQDIIFHLAANSDIPFSVKNPDYDFQNNVVGGYNVLRSCLGSNVKKFVFASSASVYGEPKYFPIDEKHITSPISPYGVSKLSIEKLGIAYFNCYKLPFTSIRMFNVYGERQTRYAMYDLFMRLFKNKKRLEVLGTGEQIRDYCYVSDAVECMVLAAEKEASTGEIINCASGDLIRIKNLAKLIVRTMALKGVEIKFSGKTWSGDVTKLVANNKKAKKILGFSAHTKIEDGLVRLYRHLLNENRSVE